MFFHLEFHTIIQLNPTCLPGVRLPGRDDHMGIFIAAYKNTIYAGHINKHIYDIFGKIHLLRKQRTINSHTIRVFNFLKILSMRVKYGIAESISGSTSSFKRRKN